MVAARSGWTIPRWQRIATLCGGLLCLAVAGRMAGEETAGRTLQVEFAGEPAAAYGTDLPLPAEQLLLAEEVSARCPQLRLDPHLCAAATAYLEAGTQVDLESLPPAFLEYALLWAGCPETLVMAATVSTTESGTSDLLDHMEETMRCIEAEVDAVGIARVPSSQPRFSWDWAYVFARRHVRMQPFPTRAEPGETPVLRFAALQPVDDARVLVMRPDSDIDEPPVNRAGGDWWSCPVDCGDEPGELWLQVVFIGAQGPEVAALLSVHVGEPRPGRWSGMPLPDESHIRTAAAAEELLLHLVDSERTGHGLAPLALDGELTRIARRHSTDMVVNDFFAHRSPAHGGLGERLAAAGYLARIARENLSRSGSVHEAHASLMLSPSHRANLLAADVSAIGIGIHQQLLADGTPQWMITEVFADPVVRLPPAELVREVAARVATDRADAGLGPLERSAVLDQWAVRIAEKAAATGAIDQELLQGAAAALARPDGAMPAVRVELVRLGLGAELEPGASVLEPDLQQLGIGIHRPAGDTEPVDVVAILVASALDEDAGQP